jgi:hypothetical protein
VERNPRGEGGGQGGGNYGGGNRGGSYGGGQSQGGGDTLPPDEEPF